MAGTDAESFASIRDEILYHVRGLGDRVSEAGIRYGSVAYLCFGDSRAISHKTRPETRQFDVEIELGADQWRIITNDVEIVSSNFHDVDYAREQFRRSVLGRRLVDLTMLDRHIELVFSNYTTIVLDLSDSPNSGFALGFQVGDQVSWETIDGNQRVQ